MPGQKAREPNYISEKEPHFLFVIAPPNTGSTALVKILSSARGAALLYHNGEGQWLIPEMHGADRWNLDRKFTMELVRDIWLARVESFRVFKPKINLIIEKSPPNMIRMPELLKAFPKHTTMAFNRNPYANCSSILYRYHSLKNITVKERAKIVSLIADKWVSRSAWIKKWIDEWDLIYFSYEDFCEAPASCISRLVADIPEMETVDVNCSIQVKNYKPQGITNCNVKTIERLSQEEVDAISTRLSKDMDLVSFFGYEIM